MGGHPNTPILAPILVAGAGSWGTALALVLARNGIRTFLWGHRTEHMAALTRERQNQRYLPGIRFPDLLIPCTDLAIPLAATREILISVPCHGLRDFCLRLSTQTRSDLRLCWACKGFESGTGKLAHEVISEVLGHSLDNRHATAVLSGPTFAREVAASRPSAITLACQDESFASYLVNGLHNTHFRTYLSTDIIGVEIGGAVKNVLAIAAGVADGLKFGANSRAALITRGLAEMTRLGIALGGKQETFMGLAGLGDLVLTCTDDQSRNRRMGILLAAGMSVTEACTEIGQVVEGTRTALEVVGQARQMGIEMPICEQVARLVKGDTSPEQAVKALLSREPALDAV